MGASPYSAPTADTTLLSTLVVDDDESVRTSISRYLSGIGHEVTTASDAASAIHETARRKFSLILLDINLPDGSGMDVLPALIEREPHVAVIMLTGVNDGQFAAAAMQRGAMDYLVKPVNLHDVERSIARALARRRDLIEQAETQSWLQREIVQRGADLRRERRNLERISVATLEALVNALEAKDPYLRGHSARVADLSAMIAAEMGLPDETVEQVRMAGRLHDLGKIGIRESVLTKRGPLTNEEFEHVKTHVVIGAQILAPLTHLREVIAFVRSHHERADGSGYPDGLADEAIPIGGRILGAAEVYDALTTARPYQEKMTPVEAVDRMRDLIGTVITTAVHSALSAVITRRGTLVFIDENDSLQ